MKEESGRQERLQRVVVGLRSRRRFRSVTRLEAGLGLGDDNAKPRPGLPPPPPTAT